MPEITRIDLVQGDAKGVTVHAVRVSPTAGGSDLHLGSVATAWWAMRLQGAASYPLLQAAASVTDATAGMLHVALGTAHTASPGAYRAQLTLDYGTAGRETAPTDEPFLVVIAAAV